MKKRQRDSQINCEVIEINKNKIRKIKPVDSNEIIDLTTDDTNNSKESTTIINTANNKINCAGISNIKKLNKNICDKSILLTKQETDSMNNSISVQNKLSSEQITSQDSAIFTHNSGLNSSDINSTECIDDLFVDDWDDDEENNSDLLKKDEKIKKNILTTKEKVVTNFSSGIDDLLFDDWSDDEDSMSNKLKINSKCEKIILSSETDIETSTNLLTVKNQSTDKINANENATKNISDSETCDLRFIESNEDLLSDVWNDNDEINDNKLDLSDYKRCKIIEINRKLRSVELTVNDLELSNTAIVSCMENWRNISLDVDEFVIIKAKYSNTENKWIINNEYGMCVTQPDTLVSGTGVIHGTFCNRKGIFQHQYAGINCLPNIEADDSALTCGSIIHQLLQMALEKKIYDLDGLWKLLDKIMKLPSTIILLYNSNLTTKQFKNMTLEYIPQIHKFMSRYILGSEMAQVDDNYAGKIESIRDIEESVWLPTLGLKGKIDVTVEVNIHKRHSIMPLEIKTGRPSFSSEHKGQVYLYVMIMQMLGHDVSSGLLLYIKENIMQEIKSTRHEQRDLLLLRNMMAYYLSRNSMIIDKSSDSSLIKSAKWKLPELPEPIYHISACKNCPYNTICCVYAKADDNLTLSDSHPFTKLQKTLLNDLTIDHIDYTVHWISLIQMESAYEKSNELNQPIYSRTPLHREYQRTCLSYMAIDLPIVQSNDLFLHKFIRNPNEKLKHLFPIDDFRQVFSHDDYIMVSTEIRMNIVSGCVVAVMKDSISLLFEKDLTKWNVMSYYHLDEFPSSTLPYRALGTVATILADNDITRRLRRIIIDKEPATFTNKLPNNLMTGYGKEIINKLNYHQQEALKSVITSTDFVLIKGMPGTGKTQTLVALIQMLSHLGNSVLITAHTHMAVDNVLLKLNEKNLDFLRLGSKKRVHPTLLHKTEDNLINMCTTPEQLEEKYNKKNIVAVTCLGSHHALLSKRIFDYCVVDECTQAMQPFLLRPLYNAIKFVLIGDPEQLPAVVRCSEARRLGMDEDLFTRLDNKNNTRTLKEQYRMNKPIMDLANRLTYNGKLVAGNETVANTTLKYKNPTVLESCEDWVKKSLSCDLENSVVMLNTRTTYNLHLTLNKHNKVFDKHDESSRCSNFIEAAIILRLLNVLIDAGINADDIGVIVPYQAQLKLFKRVIMNNIEINTVDQFQGRDKSVILLSCTRTGSSDSKQRQKDDYEVLNDHKRLNVALTRAKHKLIIVGDRINLIRFKPFEKLFRILDKEIIDLCEDRCDFSWHSVIQLIKNKISGTKTQ